MPPSSPTDPAGPTAFDLLLKKVEQSGLPFVLHEHRATRTVQEADRHLDLDVTRLVKTVGFLTRDGRLVLAGLRGTRRVDYAALSRFLGVNRRDVATLSPEQVRELLGVEPGSVSPIALAKQAVVLLDEDVLAVSPTVYCGIGRPDRTLEMTPGDLLQAAGAKPARFSK